MLAKEKWQIKTIAVLERVFEERKRQIEKHGEAMRDLPDGVGPGKPWLRPVAMENTAENLETLFRMDYELEESRGRLTRMHLVREELAEAFMEDPDSPEFVDEILQVAALCVQWAEYKMDDLEKPETYRGYRLHPRPQGGVGIFCDTEPLAISHADTVAEARRVVDGWLNAV